MCQDFEPAEQDLNGLVLQIPQVFFFGGEVDWCHGPKGAPAPTQSPRKHQKTKEIQEFEPRWTMS